MGLGDIFTLIYDDKKVQAALVVGGLVVTWYIWTNYAKQDEHTAILVPSIIEQWRNNCAPQNTKENRSDFLRFWRGGGISLLTVEDGEAKLKPLDPPPDSAAHEDVLKLINEILTPHIKASEAPVSETSLRVLKCIGICNMVDYILSNGEIPAAYQPHFVIQCMGKGNASSIRVISNAFIGNPKGVGTDKYTDTRLRLASSNLLYGDVSFIVARFPTKHETIHDVLKEDIGALYFETVLNDEIAYGQYSNKYEH